MKHLPTITLFFACLLLAVACDTETGDGGGAGSKTLTAATWNVGLAYNFVSFSAEREPEVVKAIAAAKQDVLCVQEVWTDSDIADIEKAAKAAGFTDVYYEKTPEDTAGLAVACTEGDSKDLGACATKNCSDSKDLVSCVQTKCPKSLASISDNCLTCLASNLSLSLKDILTKCAEGGAKFSWGGYNGLLLLSRKPLSKKKHTLFDSALVRRSVLTAEVASPDGKGTIQLACTHLTAGLSSVKYPGTQGSWEKEQAAQIDTMLKMMRPASEGPSIIMGDLNTSPGKGTVTAEYPDNFKKFLDAGYADAWYDGTPKCTFCGSNTLVAGGADKGGENAVLDHVLVRGWKGTTKATERLFEGTFKVKDKDGKEQDSNLSDHFGVGTTLTAP